MSKKLAFILVVLLIVPASLTACSNESADTGKDYVEAALKGDAEQAQKFACDDYKDETETLAGVYAGLAEQQQAIRNIDLKYDIGKGHNEKEVIVTGAYDIVQLNAQGKEIADSAVEYALAASTPDKRDFNQNGDDTDRINTRIVLTMNKTHGDWCVAKLEGGYFFPIAAAEPE
jgi:predicted small secreted protein